MKERILKSQKLSHAKHYDLATAAAREAMNELKKEGYYTEENSEMLWRTAWSAADYALVCEEADYEDATWAATEAARRRARAIHGCLARLEYIRVGKITPAWRVQLAQLQQQKMAQ